jgi:Tfp pilus assembly PilM family ATPase
LSGGASRVDGFQKALEDRFSTVIEAFNPFQKISFDPAKLGVSDADRVTTATAVAVGLALRAAGDR